MDTDKYISERLDFEINWLDEKSRFHKSRFQLFKGIEITLAAFIPFIAGFSNSTDNPVLNLSLRILSGLLGVGIIIATGFLSLNKYKDNWIEYRSTYDLLLMEKYLFITKSPPYDTENALSKLVDRVESIIISENKRWVQYITEQKPSTTSTNQ